MKGFAQSKDHWEHVYQTKPTDSVSWFQEHAQRSLQLIRQTGIEPAAPIIDVGGGASTLVDDLLAAGHSNLTVLDLSSAALAAARKRLGPQLAGRVTWLEADITEVELPAHAYALWHDRALFHFLTAGEDRQKYVEAVLRAVKPGGHVIVATFAADGPTRCSGLPVVRYDPAELQAALGTAFDLVRYERDTHATPFGTVQQFVFCHFTRRAT